ncbi:hypothetical protein EJB05_13965, partial [Eragrostis curvula]
MDPPELMDELVEEVLLRVPPDDPATLARAALVAKRWCRLVPMLGFLCDPDAEADDRGFHPTSSFRPPRADRRGLRVHDTRHGRVLLHKHPYYHGAVSLVVWDPITGERRELPRLPREATRRSWKATVLCTAAAAAGDCDHLDCHRGPFVVVFVGTDNDEMFSCVFSSEAGTWSNPVFAQHPGHRLGWGRSALVGNVLYMLFQKKKKRILKYDLSTGQKSVIKVPPVRTTKVSKPYVPIELMTMEDGRLGFARVVRSRLFLWSTNAEGARWELREVIELKDLLPLEDPIAAATPNLVGFAEGVGVIFLTVGLGTFALDVKFNRVAKVHS